VHEADSLHRADGALDSADENTELGAQLLGQVAGRREVPARLEEDDNGQAARLVERPQPPALVRPDVRVVRCCAGMAVDASGAVARLLSLDGRRERSGLRGPLERPCVPLAHRRRLQTVVGSLPELLRRLRHRTEDNPTVEWPAEFYALRRGEGCPMCAEARPDETRFGLRILAGDVTDAYLQRAGIQRGYTIVLWRGRHVAEPDGVDGRGGCRVLARAARRRSSARESFRSCEAQLRAPRQLASPSPRARCAAL